MNTDEKIAHLEMLQRAVDRMANAEFLVRGWSVTLVSAFFALAAKDADKHFFAVAYFPIIAFWILDGFYLSNERAFRALFDTARQHTGPVDFAMTPKTGVSEWIGACFAVPVVLFYLVLALSTSIVIWMK
jgi:hypothetical protein